jgi:hypothetical protein
MLMPQRYSFYIFNLCQRLVLATGRKGSKKPHLLANWLQMSADPQEITRKKMGVAGATSFFAISQLRRAQD